MPGERLFISWLVDPNPLRAEPSGHTTLGCLSAFAGTPTTRKGGDDMRNVRRVVRQVLVSSALVGVLAFASTAGAQTCPSACGAQKRACLQTARTAQLACKSDCRATTPTPRTALGECMRGCMTT